MGLGFVCSHFVCKGGSDTKSLCPSGELGITCLCLFVCGSCGFSTGKQKTHSSTNTSDAAVEAHLETSVLT